MKIDKYISELLFEHECVIVPGFGGFIVNDRRSTIDLVTHQFTPPFKKLLFNQHIRFNDGLLINYIAAKNEISFEKVRHQVDEIVSQYIARLEKGDKIQFENIGFLTFDENKNILFDQDYAVNYNPESFGLGSIVSPPIKRKIEDEPIKGIVYPQPVVSKHEDRKPEPVVSEVLKPRYKRRSTIKRANFRGLMVISLIAVMVASFALAYFNSEITQNTWQELSSAITPKSEQKHYIPRSGQKNELDNAITNQAGFLSGSLFETKKAEVVNTIENVAEDAKVGENYSVENISVVDYINYRGRNFEESKETIDVESESIASENTIIENVPVIEPVEATMNEKIVVSVKPSSQYYIIAGAFSEESNAKGLILELLQKGFSAQIIDTTKNGLYRVAYLRVETLTEAKQKLYAIREDDNSEAWILKK